MHTAPYLHNGAR